MEPFVKLAKKRLWEIRDAYHGGVKDDICCHDWPTYCNSVSTYLYEDDYCPRGRCVLCRQARLKLPLGLK